MTEFRQNGRRKSRFICKCTPFGSFIEFGKDASDMHIRRIMVARIKRIRKPGSRKRPTIWDCFLYKLKINSTVFSLLCLLVLIFVTMTVLPRWIPRGNPEGVYDARIWLANCLCDDGRGFLVVTNDGTWQAVYYHPGMDYINIPGTWKKDRDDDLLVFEFKDLNGKSFTFHARCYWGGLEWTEEMEEPHPFWFPRLLSEVYCDYYNKYSWYGKLGIAFLILAALFSIITLTEIREATALKKQITRRHKP